MCSRTAACQREWARRQYVPRPKREPSGDPCECCGTPTASKLRVCRRTPACQQESSRRLKPATSVYRPCEVCGQRTTAALRLCRRTPECRSERARRARGADREAVHERERAHRQASGDIIRAANRRYLQRADRACRHAAAGCEDFATPGSLLCPEHNRADCRRRYERKRDALTRALAAAQAWRCTWCELPLPVDLVGVAIDHIIPKASGLVIEEGWNLQALHTPCNGSKKDKLTPQALELAHAHGLMIMGAAAA